MSSALTLLLGLGSVGLAIALAVVALLSRQQKEAAEGPNDELAISVQRRRDVYEEPLPSIMVRLRDLTIRLTPNSYGARLQRRLDLAGNPVRLPAERFMALKGVALVFGVLLGAVIGVHRGWGLLLFALIGGAVAFWVPDLLLRVAGERRQEELRKGLPDVLDMLTVCVEAGLGFDSALGRVATNLEGPMSSECARVMQEMQFGKSRTEALRALADRTDVAEIKVFVSAFIQAGELGISIGAVLREQAAEMRVRRRQRAEEKAQKLPVKILLPLITCLLPAMFVVVLGPAAIKIVHTLGHLSA
jgi:pilus assembly protein TadC